MKKLKKLYRTSDEIDYFKVLSRVDFVELGNESYLSKVRSVLVDGLGLEEVLLRDGYLFINKAIGIKFYYGLNPFNKMLYLDLELTGHFFIVEGYFEKIDKIIKDTFLALGLLPKINRIDIRMDILSKNKSLRNCFYFFPKFFKKNDSVMTMKGKRSTRHLKANFSQYFNNQENLGVPTGFKVQTSRFSLSVYERLINLQDKLKKKRISQTYHDYYMKEYRGYRSVSRVELRLKQESCHLANILYFSNGSKYKKNKSLFIKKLKAFWANGHKVYDINKTTRERDCVNKVFSELFNLSDYKSIKEVRSELGVELGTGLFCTARTKKRGSSYYLKQLAKSLVNEGRSGDSVDYVLNELKESMSNLHKRENESFTRYEATLRFFNSSEDELRTIRDKILENNKKSDSLRQEVNLSRRYLNSHYEELLLSS